MACRTDKSLPAHRAAPAASGKCDQASHHEQRLQYPHHSWVQRRLATPCLRSQPGWPFPAVPGPPPLRPQLPLCLGLTVRLSLGKGHFTGQPAQPQKDQRQPDDPTHVLPPKDLPAIRPAREPCGREPLWLRKSQFARRSTRGQAGGAQLDSVKIVAAIEPYQIRAAPCGVCSTHNHQRRCLLATPAPCCDGATRATPVTAAVWFAPRRLLA